MDCLLAVALAFLLSSCAAPLHVQPASFKLPSSYVNHDEIDGLAIAIVPVLSPERSKTLFGTNMEKAGILPVHIIVHNKGTNEFELNTAQTFAETAEGEMQVAYTLGQAAQGLRQSSIGTSVATRAALGGLAGAAAGAALGAGIATAGGGDAGQGAAGGAAIGGTVGVASGVGAGASDSITEGFQEQLATSTFGDQVIEPADIKQGFIYFKWRPYTHVRVKIFNITTGKTEEMIFRVHVPVPTTS